MPLTPTTTLTHHPSSFPTPTNPPSYPLSTRSPTRCVLDDITALAHPLAACLTTSLHSPTCSPTRCVLDDGCLVGFSAVLDYHGRSWTLERDATVTARHSSMGFCVANAACANRAAYDGAYVESAVCCVVWLRKASRKIEYKHTSRVKARAQKLHNRRAFFA